METSPGQKVAVVVGDGQIAGQCARLIAEHEALRLPVILHHENERAWSSQLEKICRQLSIPLAAVANVNDRKAIELLKDAGPDIIFSINNWDIIRQDVLTLPRDGVINFHNGPLPGYRGVNVPSWAIINGEKRHGVTWHYVETGIDTGDIVASETFGLRPDETAISLTLRCIAAGVSMFPALLDRYVSGKLEGEPQTGEAHYYSNKATPNDGYLDFSLNFQQLSALVRGLTFRPFDNPFTWPKIRTGGGNLLVSVIRREGGRTGEEWVPGAVREFDDTGMLVCAGDALVHLSGLMEDDLSAATASSLAGRHGIAAGSVLAPGAD